MAHIIRFILTILKLLCLKLRYSFIFHITKKHFIGGIKIFIDADISSNYYITFKNSTFIPIINERTSLSNIY